MVNINNSGKKLHTYADSLRSNKISLIDCLAAIFALMLLINCTIRINGTINTKSANTERYTEASLEKAIPEKSLDFEKDANSIELDYNLVIDSGDDFTPEVPVKVDMDVERANQISVDSGSSPWRLDPIFVAQVFVSLQISPDGIFGDYPIDYDDFVIAKNLGNKIIIDVHSEKTNIRKVYLERLIRQDETGIWTVIGYDISS